MRILARWSGRRFKLEKSNVKGRAGAGAGAGVLAELVVDGITGETAEAVVDEGVGGVGGVGGVWGSLGGCSACVIGFNGAGEGASCDDVPLVCSDVVPLVVLVLLLLFTSSICESATVVGSVCTDL